MTTPCDMPDRRYRSHLVVILLAGLILRAGLIAYAALRPAVFDFPDSHRYVRVARNIAAGNGPIESESVRAGTDPAYPALLAVGIRLGCESTSAIMTFGRVANGLFGLGVVVLIAALGSTIFSRRVGLMAASWGAVDPILLFFNALVLTELPYIALLLAAALLLTRCNATGRVKSAVMAGVVLGIATLTRSSGLFLLPLYAGWLVVSMWRSAAPRRAVAAACAMLLATAVAMLPIVVRNYGLFGAFVPVRTGSGASLMEALGPWADGGPGMDRIEYPPTPVDGDEVERDRVYRRTALEWARANPGDVLSLAGRKLARTWSITINAAGYQSAFVSTVCWLTVAPVFALAVVGAWRLRRRPALLSLLLLPGAYFTLVHMVFVGSVRYRLPAMPFLFLLAAIALDAVVTRLARHRTATKP